MTTKVREGVFVFRLQNNCILFACFCVLCVCVLWKLDVNLRREYNGC